MVSKLSAFDPIQVRDVDTGIVKTYPTSFERAKEEGVVVEAIIRKVQYRPDWVSSNRCQYRPDAGDQPWPLRLESRFILVKNLETGEITRYESQLQAAEAIGITNVRLSSRLKNKLSSPVNEIYAVKYEFDQRPWEEFVIKTKSEDRPRKDRKIDLSDPELGEYRTLPMYPGIRIYKKGFIVRESTSSIIGAPNADGYISLTVKTVNNWKTTFRAHRLIAMAYHGIPENMDELHVNHIDFNRSNNAASNLEWVTPRDNLKHSGFLNKESGIRFKPIQVRDFNTKEVRLYETMLEASADLGMHKDNVQLRANTGDSWLWPERLQYRLDQGDAPWNENPDSDFIKVFDLKTKEEKLFLNSTAVCLEYGLSPAAVSVNLNDRAGKPIKYRWIVKKESDKTPWPHVADLYTYLLENTQLKPIVAYNPVTKDKKIFEAAVECAREMNVKPSALHMRLKSGKPEKVYSDGYQYSYYSPAKQ